MQISITGRHGLDLTPAIQAHTLSKLSHLAHLGVRITTLRVVLEVEKLKQIAKATFYLAGHAVNVRVSAMDLYTAIDHLVRKVKLQLATVHHKSQQVARRQTYRRHSARLPHPPGADELREGLENLSSQ